MYSDELMELLLAKEEEYRSRWCHSVTRSAVAQLEFTPVFLGSAYRSKGVQALLDAVVRLLPSPLDCRTKAFGKDHEGHGYEMQLVPRPRQAHRGDGLQDGRGPLRHADVHADLPGAVCQGRHLFQSADRSKERFSRILRMHADQREDIAEAEAGDIVAVLGVNCASGDTYAAERNYCTLENMFVPEPVIRMAITPANRDGADRLSKALHRFRREDPTLRVTSDPETGETLIAGMGELHLDIYVERIRREYNVAVEIGEPKVNYREAPRSRPSSTPATASRPAARASTPTSSGGSTCCRRMPRRPSSSRSTSSGDECRNSSFRRWKRAFGRCS